MQHTSVSESESADVTPAAPRVPSPVERLDRRRSPRQTLVAEANLRSYDEPSKSAKGYVSNISTTGVGFHAPAAVAVGSRFKIRMDAGPMKWAAKVRIVSCRPHESGTYDVGAEFLEETLARAA